MRLFSGLSKRPPFITRLLASPKYNACVSGQRDEGTEDIRAPPRPRVPAAVAPREGRLRHREKMEYSKRKIFHSRSLQEKENEKKKEKRILCNLAHSRFLSPPLLPPPPSSPQTVSIHRFTWSPPASKAPQPSFSSRSRPPSLPTILYSPFVLAANFIIVSAFPPVPASLSIPLSPCGPFCPRDDCLIRLLWSWIRPGDIIV